MTRLEVRGVTKSYRGRNVLEDVSFETTSDDVLAVIGPSGGGKTTLFRCILGEARPDRGRVLVDGVDITDMPLEKRGVGIVYQNYAIFPHLTVTENVAYGLRARRTPEAEVRRRVREMLDTVQLAEKADRYPDRLSGGEKQRVALARALIVEPRLLLLDEAFTALDATTRAEVVQEVRRIIRKFGVTTLLITHDQEEAFLFSRNVLVLNEGNVVTIGPPERVMTHPHPFIQEFVKMLLFHEATVEAEDDGATFVTTEGGARIPISIPGISRGDVVHVMVKKGPENAPIKVWPTDGA